MDWSDYIDILIDAGSTARLLNADLYGAYERMEPWLGYQWGTNAPALVLDLVLTGTSPPTATNAGIHHQGLRLRGCNHSLVSLSVHKSVLQRAPEMSYPVASKLGHSTLTQVTRP